jgi:hypothetical protein
MQPKPTSRSLLKRGGAKGEAPLHSRHLRGAEPLRCHEDLHHFHHTRGEGTWILGGLGIIFIINFRISIISMTISNIFTRLV